MQEEHDLDLETPAMKKRRERRRKLEELEPIAAALTELKNHESWPVFVEEINKTIKRSQDRLGRRLFLTNGPVDQRMVDFLRGYFAGLKYLTAVPEEADAALKNAIKRVSADLPPDEDTDEGVI